jgi:quercetin dioxygenase-like cupin family protein
MLCEQAILASNERCGRSIMRAVTVDFSRIAWGGTASSGRRVKAATLGDKRVRLFEMTPGYAEQDWCSEGHMGYVLQGEFVAEFEDGSEIWSRGTAFLIPAGTAHRNANRSQVSALVFLIDDQPAS